MKKLLIAVTCLAAVGSLSAQELSEAAAQASEDNGAAVVAKVEEKTPEMKAEPTEEFVSAEDRVRSNLEKAGISEGADPEKKAIIQIGVASVLVSNPATDKAFGMAREQMANIAYMNAKAEVIKAINSEFSAVDRVSLMMSESVDENAEKVAAAREAVIAKRAELAETLAKYNAADAKSVSEVTLNDRFNSFLDAVIKKIDSSYSPEAIAAKKKISADAAKAEAAALKEKVQALSAEYKKLEAAAAALPKDPAMESASTAKVMSKMPLLGSSILTMAESWNKDTQEYQVACAIVWSPKLQACATKMLTGDFSGTGKPGMYSKDAWVKAQDWRWMIGTRRFTDDKGRNLFVGIYSVELSGSIVAQNGKKKLADQFARKNVAMSLLSDMATFTEASQNMKIYADDSKSAAQKLSENTTSKVNVNLQGCMRLTSRTVTNPISGKKMYVSAFYLDPTIAAEAGAILKKSYEDALTSSKYAKKQFGILMGLSGALDTVNHGPIVPVTPTPDGVKPGDPQKPHPVVTPPEIPTMPQGGNITTPPQKLESDY